VRLSVFGLFFAIFQKCSTLCLTAWIDPRRDGRSVLKSGVQDGL
jgi:hypothetical protein